MKTRQRKERKAVHAIGADCEGLEALELEECKFGESIEGRNAEGKRDQTGQIGASEMSGLEESKATEIESLESG